ncbi:MAG TPA: 16S rRNA (guanine(527)-N(7))-methyltransferase RsmG [Gammaproteobacteria bacterium]|nr:16S rRNA (guanine(527)-N(7))-methyltransferase RsmG [Gammaproteobacteria bacterium]
MKPMKDFLHASLLANQLVLSPEMEEKCLAYLDLLQKWNRIYNLTAIHDAKESVLLHIIDSLLIRPYLHGSRCIDVGTGAGLPGIPLALTCPDRHFVLLDSNSKKTRFLSQVLYELPLKNVEIVHARVENFNPAEKFDSILSRAFASLQAMLEATRHLVSEQGYFLAMKGIYPEAEINAISTEFTVTAVQRLTISGLDVNRHLVCITKGATIG